MQTQTTLSFLLLSALSAGCLSGSSSQAEDTLLAKEVPTQVTKSSSGDFFVDSSTELGWSTRVSVELRYSEALPYCESLGAGWRLPTLGELGTLMEAASNQKTMRQEFKKGVPNEGVLFSSEEVPVIDDDKRPLVMRIADGKTLNGHGLEGYALCVHGSVSRKRKPFREPPPKLLGERWWESSEACPAGSVARGTPGLVVSCKSELGQKHGRTTSWPKEGRITASYGDGRLHGKMTRWNPQGTRTEVVNYQEGQFHGATTRWLKDGTKSEVLNYREGKFHGEITRWRAGLKYEVLSYQDGKLWGKTTRWLKDGTKSEVLTYRDDKLHGETTRWREGIRSEVLTYQDGKLTGKTTRWRADGTMSEVLSYRDNKLNGVTTRWRSDGKKSEVLTYRDNTLHGVTTRWHPNGKKAETLTYRSGELHGRSTHWHASGKKANEALFSSGVLHGLQQSWNKKGQPQLRTTYRNGRIADRLYYDRGKPRNGSIQQKHGNGVDSYVGVFKKGRAIGQHYGYYENKKLRFKRNYNPKGIPHGPSADWHPNGLPHKSNKFANGAFHGEQVVTDAQGKTLSRVTYDQGVVVKP